MGSFEVDGIFLGNLCFEKYLRKNLGNFQEADKFVLGRGCSLASRSMFFQKAEIEFIKHLGSTNFKFEKHFVDIMQALWFDLDYSINYYRVDDFL